MAKKKKQARDANGRFAKKYYGDPGNANIWQPMNRSGGSGSYDVFGGQQEPGPVELLNAYEDVVYACVRIISDNLSALPLRLCATTAPGEPRPKSASKSLNMWDRRRLDRDYTKWTRRALDVVEVTDHPILDLLDRPNPTQSWFKLMGLVSTYLELIGSAFLYTAKDGMGNVRELWLLPSHLVRIEVDDQGAVVAYLFGSGEAEERYRPNDIIHIRSINPMDPYSSFGTPPVRSVWQRFMLLRQEQSSWQAVLTNMAMPSTLVFPAEGEDWTNMQAERVAKQISERFRMGQGGGTWVVQDHLQVQPLTVPPKDLSALQLWEQIRTSVCNAYGVPKSLLDMTDTTGSAADTVMRSFQMHCLKPRIENILDALSHRLCPPRLFLVTSEILQPDRTFELQRASAAWQANLITQNEGRIGLGYDPVNDGDKYLYQLIGNSPGQGGTMGTLPSFTGNSLKVRNKAYTSSVPDPTPLVEALRPVLERQREQTLNKFKHLDGIVEKAWVPMENWNREFTKAAEPVLRLYADQGAGGIFGEIGGDDAMKRHAVQLLDQSVAKLALAFADSTNSTTAMKVDEAAEATREAIRNGLDAGEANQQLATRIGEIFTDLVERRVMLIAETESSRTKHAGELVAIEAAGVEAKKVWLCDNMACDQCRGLNGKAVGLDTPFAVKDGGGPYAEVAHPPYHPGCRCTLQYDLGMGA